jgi:hypothetical protein
MKPKTVVIDGKTYVVTDDKGLPIYVHDDGKEVSHDAAATVQTITRLNGEAKTHREAKEAAETRLKDFEGIEDPAAARTALETVANLGAGELKTAAQVEEIKAAARKAAEDNVVAAKKGLEEQVAKLTKENGDLRGGWDNEKIGTAFSGSKFVKEKTLLPPAAAAKIFGDKFKVEDGKLVGYKADGSKIYSREKPGELAQFDEAVSQLVDEYPDRADILRAEGGGSGGRQQGGGGGGGDGKTISRREFDGLDAGARMAKMKEGVTVVDTP